MSQDIIQLKKGASFEMTVEYLPPAGTTQTLENLTVSSQIRTLDGKLLDDVIIEVFENYKGFTCTVLDTTSWPVGRLMWDIKFTDNDTSSSFYSETVILNIVKSVTE